MNRSLFRALSGIPLSCSLVCFGIGANAQEPQETGRDTRLYRLINIATPELPDVRRGVYDVDLRAMGAAEGKTYWGLGGQYGLRSNLSVFGRVTFSDKRFYTQSAVPVPTGGTEWEVGARFRILQRGDVEGTAQVSVLYPNNARGSSPEFAGQIQFSRRLGDRTVAYFVPKVLLGNQSIFTLGGGVSHRLNSDWVVFGDLQGPIGTDNTYSITSGARWQREIWGAGFRYQPEAFNGRASLDLGITNGLGQTSGYSMQPGLSGSAAFFVNLMYRM